MFQGFRATSSFIVTQFQVESYTKWFSNKIFRRRRPIAESVYDIRSDRICIIGRVTEWQQIMVLLLHLKQHAFDNNQELPESTDHLIEALGSLRVLEKQLR